MPLVRVFVCGSPDRGDDAAAIRAVEELDPTARALAEIDVCGALGVEDLIDVPSDGACLVLDAAIGIEPGAIVGGSLGSLADRARSAGPAPHSSHILPMHETLALVQTLRGDLPRGGFLGLGSASFGFGEPLSPAVERALPAYREAIAREILRLDAEIRDAAARTAHPPHADAAGPEVRPTAAPVAGERPVDPAGR